MIDIEAEIKKYEKVCAAAEDHGHQGFRVTPGFFRSLIADWARLKRQEIRLKEYQAALESIERALND